MSSKLATKTLFLYIQNRVFPINCLLPFRDVKHSQPFCSVLVLFGFSIANQILKQGKPSGLPELSRELS